MNMKLVLICFILCFCNKFASASLQGPVDLSWEFGNRTVHWPSNQNFIYTKVYTGYPIWYKLQDYATGEHVGTHIDAPYHFYDLGKKVGEIPPEKLFLPGVCINLVNETNINGPNTVLLPRHITEWEARNGIQIPEKSLLLVAFGWSQHFLTSPKYLYNDNGDMEFPGISVEAANILAEKNLYGVGVDTASIDPGFSETFEAHQMFAKKGYYNLENVKIPLDFPETGFFVYVGVPKFEEGTGAPARIIAMPVNGKPSF